MPANSQMGLLMLLRGIDCLGQHSAGTDSKKANAGAYCDIGLSALQGDDGVWIACMPWVSGLLACVLLAALRQSVDADSL
jgi:hypothetical protein